MKPLADWPLAQRRQIRGVFTDIDDTLTTDGAITPDALQALVDLRDAGLEVIAITGRPVGWSEPFAYGDASRQLAPWPVNAIVAENGAVALFLSQIGPERTDYLDLPLSKLYQQDAPTRLQNYRLMQQITQRVLAQVSGVSTAQDSAGRETDIAFDHSEFAHLSPEKIAQVVHILRNEGMNATVSSIHINAWFGDHNKLEGARWVTRALFGRDLGQEMHAWAYVGDSTNDQLMFEHFENSVGVANIERFKADLSHLPRFVTPSARGAGFAEVAKAILESR